MTIEYHFGNLLDSQESVIAHGCNARGVMRSGIARDISDRYPQAFNDYFVECRDNSFDQPLGSVIETRYPDRTILSIISQRNFGRNSSVRYVSYDAIANAINRINTLGYTRVAFPMIGAGLANGNWTVISSIIESYSDFAPIVYYIDETRRKEFGG